MAQTKMGAAKTAAKYYNLSLEEYLSRLQTQKACKICKQWKDRSEFVKDKSSSDGLSKRCFGCGRVKIKKCTKGRITWMKGKKHNEETRKKMRQARKQYFCNHPGRIWTEEQKLKQSKTLKQVAKKGPESASWKGGITPENHKLRSLPEYEDWRKSVFERDKYTCQKCGDNKGGNLQAHHLEPFADCLDLRFTIDNGLTLCENCHRLVHYKPDSRKNKKLIKSV